MSYSVKQWRAIDHFLKKNGYRPELSAFPVVRYTSRATGEAGEMHITTIEDIYTGDRERQKRELAEARKEERRKKRKGGS